MTSVLLLVDIQTDFMPGGTLAVQNGDEVIPIANKLSSSKKFDYVIATRDWHPEDHSSWKIFPPHCVARTPGADFAAGLDTSKINFVFHKGMDKDVDSFSGFFDNNGKDSGLGGLLRSVKVDDIYLVGVAWEYCLHDNALDAVKLGFNTYVISDGCRAVDKNSIEGVIQELRNNGVRIITSESLVP